MPAEGPGVEIIQWFRDKTGFAGTKWGKTVVIRYA
jgi:hypothetical protein